MRQSNPQAANGQNDPESLLGKVSRELAALEKRDWELWLIVAITGMLVASGFLALIFPAAVLRGGNLRMELEVSRELFFGLLVLLVLFNTYMISRRLQLRRARGAVISMALQSELVRLQSFTDPLTEVYNRRSLDEMARRFTSRAARLGKPLTFMVIDADHFKEVNTRFGHLMGDFVLSEIAILLKAAVRGSDAVVRIGGDEFLIILADSSLEGGQVVATRIAKSLEDWNTAGHLDKFHMTLSIGLAEWASDKTLDEVLNEADRAMYSTKDARTNRPTSSTPSKPSDATD
jgi:diguanylate cyclase (GGDEF)-like protein